MFRALARTYVLAVVWLIKSLREETGPQVGWGIHKWNLWNLRVLVKRGLKHRILQKLIENLFLRYGK